MLTITLLQFVVFVKEVYKKMHKLKEFRVKKGFTQFELASIMGVSQQTISSYENNSRKMDNDFILRVSMILDITPNELLGFDEAYAIYTDYLLSLKKSDINN